LDTGNSFGIFFEKRQLIDIRNLISNLGKEKTVLLSTHIMQEVEAICERAIN
jgi:ABC-2 type transport system ATP-binding protein